MIAFGVEVEARGLAPDSGTPARLQPFDLFRQTVNQPALSSKRGAEDIHLATVSDEAKAKAFEPVTGELSPGNSRASLNGKILSHDGRDCTMAVDRG